VLADKAYDADRIRELIQDQGATPNIPPKSNRKWKPCFSKRLYRERNLIERFFSKLKHFRRVATRYDKLAANFLAMIQLASMRLWLRAYESTPRRELLVAEKAMQAHLRALQRKRSYHHRA
jgi:transposase